MHLRNPYPDTESPNFLWRNDVFESYGFALSMPAAEIDPLLRQYATVGDGHRASDFMWGKKPFQLCRVIDGEHIRYVVVRLTATTWEVVNLGGAFANGIRANDPRSSIAFAACNPIAARFASAEDAVRAAIAAFKREG